jgi:hypothetical protein
MNKPHLDLSYVHTPRLVSDAYIRKVSPRRNGENGSPSGSRDCTGVVLQACRGAYSAPDSKGCGCSGAELMRSPTFA